MISQRRQTAYQGGQALLLIEEKKAVGHGFCFFHSKILVGDALSSCYRQIPKPMVLHDIPQRTDQPLSSPFWMSLQTSSIGSLEGLKT